MRAQALTWAQRGLPWLFQYALVCCYTLIVAPSGYQHFSAVVALFPAFLFYYLQYSSPICLTTACSGSRLVEVEVRHCTPHSSLATATEAAPPLLLPVSLKNST
ncbi:hypothetical protein NDU88_008941 [Pleurodeles waltl]|uniref:Uncharacterized protein n=1 Tax=Pleurodeles waltl TaxID=8319 RepID=A0AAV7NXS3_PLEWA|nr:hypothetical protein NDU88_008941 [Pleurodeles waltl]